MALNMLLLKFNEIISNRVYSVISCIFKSGCGHLSGPMMNDRLIEYIVLYDRLIPKITSGTDLTRYFSPQ